MLVYLDGVYIETLTTASDGTFQGQVYAAMDLARGNGHSIEVVLGHTRTSQYAYGWYSNRLG